MRISDWSSDVCSSDLYARSVEDAHVYWLEQAGRLDWVNFPAKTNESSFDEADFGVKWFADGVLNVSANCIDRHLATRGDQTAIIWEPDSPEIGRAHV